MPRVFIGIGSNVEPEHNIARGVAQLRAVFGPMLCSPVYRNSAAGFVGDDFYNLVVGFDTVLAIDAIVTRLREIEQAHGRHRGDAKFAPRTLDLDLLIYGDTVLTTAQLTLPRADILEYAFVLRPLADIAPNERHPLTHATYRELWQHRARGSMPMTQVADFLSASK